VNVVIPRNDPDRNALFFDAPEPVCQNEMALLFPIERQIPRDNQGVRLFKLNLPAQCREQNIPILGNFAICILKNAQEEIAVLIQFGSQI